MTHTRRERDALIRNSRPTKQLRLIDPHKRKMPKKGTTITIHYGEEHKDRIEQIKAFIKRHGFNVEFKKVEK